MRNMYLTKQKRTDIEGAIALCKIKLAENPDYKLEAGAVQGFLEELIK